MKRGFLQMCIFFLLSYKRNIAVKQQDLKCHHEISSANGHVIKNGVINDYLKPDFMKTDIFYYLFQLTFIIHTAQLPFTTNG